MLGVHGRSHLKLVWEAQERLYQGGTGGAHVPVLVAIAKQLGDTPL